MTRLFSLALMGVLLGGSLLPPSAPDSAAPPTTETTSPAIGEPEANRVSKELPLQVRFESPAPGRVVFGPARIEVSVLPPGTAVERVEFFLDGERCAEDRDSPYAYEWDAGYEFFSHHIEVVAHVPGRAPARASMETTRVAVRERVEVEDEPYDLIEISFVVTRSDGRPVRGLDRRDFQLEVDRSAVPIETLVEERRRRPADHARQTVTGGHRKATAVSDTHDRGVRRPLSVALLLDVSRSMRLIERERFLLAVQRLLDHLRTEDEMMIISFSNDYEIRTDFTSDPRTLHDALVSVPAPDLGTNLYDAIGEALDRLARRRGRRVVILYSDGQATAGRSSLTATPASLNVMDQTRRAPITLYWIIPHFQDARIVQSTPSLRRLATGSGGRWILETDGIETVLDEIGEELKSQYSASFFVDKKKHRRPYYEINLKARSPSLKVQAPTLIKGSGSLVRRLEEMLNGDDLEERAAAAIQLPRYGYSQAYYALRSRYGREKDPEVRDAVLAALLVVLRDKWQEIDSQPPQERQDSLRHIERQITRLKDPRALALLKTLH
ncbi:MAG: VWA domain-containing protein [Acidobacteriota bacterium]